MPFERFVGTGRSYAVRMSISKAGLISFNNGATKRFGIDKHSHCVLFYDKQDRRIGIHLTNDEAEPGARKLRIRESGADVAAKVFFDYYGIAVKETMVYEPTMDADEAMVIVNLGAGKARKRGPNSEG